MGRSQEVPGIPGMRGASWAAGWGSSSSVQAILPFIPLTPLALKCSRENLMCPPWESTNGTEGDTGEEETVFHLFCFQKYTCSLSQGCAKSKKP